MSGVPGRAELGSTAGRNPPLGTLSVASDWVGLRHLQAKKPEAATAKAKAHSDITRRPGSVGGWGGEPPGVSQSSRRALLTG